MSRTRWIVALLLGVLTVVALARSHRSVGYVRDEGIYFEASRSYAAWVDRLVKDPASAMRPRVRDRHFAINHEHPAFMKTVAGLSAAALADAPAHGDASARRRGWMPEGAAMRLPAQILSGLGVALLFAIGVRLGGMWTGLVCAGWFVTLPRVWFHAGLHTFDVPVAVASLAVVLAYRASLRRRGWGLALGPILGVAIAIKHNALFLGPLLALHYWMCLGFARWRHGATIRRAQLVPLPLWSMAIFAPLTSWALWPWLWRDPWARLEAYFAFHRHHNWYNMEFLGLNYNQPPMPVTYPSVMTWATVPTVCLMLAVLGLLLWARRDLRPNAEGRDRETPSFSRPLPEGWSRLEGVGLAALALFPILLISLPSTPIFGGTKHWLTAYPFMAIGAAFAWGRLWEASRCARRRLLEPLGVLLCLGPSLMATVDGHPYNLSQYAPLVGGPRGAAELGLNRGFWGHAVVALLPEAARAAGPNGRIYLHDLDRLAQKQYAREGRWPENLEPAPLGRSDVGLLFHEKHMATEEIDLWQHTSTTAPIGVVTLDDVPLTSLYAR